MTGLKSAVEVDPTLEKQFVYGEKDTQSQPDKMSPKPPASEVRESKGQAAISRSPLTTRVRTDFATALKRASLERQLSGEFPQTLQDILEDALEHWLRTHGYIK
ncbi:MAG: hypothetical protein K8U57_28430 [Planctomycetes bacterium]|nr:hypothetical protein [Planctomycetota bacterium]